MTSIRELAPAKINLTLEIVGRLGTGYHQLDSLVTFADLGDAVTLEPGAPAGVTIGGPMADALSGHRNILDTVLSALRAEAPRLALGAVHLEKHLPVAAGIGGGSADAGALLRTVRRANGSASDDVDWHALARALGADVPVCLESRPLRMTGAGDGLAEVPGGMPSLAAVLVNPLVEVPADKTARVFRALRAGAVPAGYAVPGPPRFADRAALIAFMRARGNHLADAAQAVVPDIRDVMAVLGTTPGIEYAAVSGAGPTCFGVFPDREAAEAARRTVASARPDWWAVAVTLG